MKLFLDEWAKRKLQTELRFVGGPKSVAEKFAQAYPNVTYLGPLNDQDFSREVATWCGFVQPLFCYARGCSTKLAVGLGLEIPTITTPAGARGYTWKEGSVSLGETPRELVDWALKLAHDQSAREQARMEIQRAARSCPPLQDVAQIARQALESLSEKYTP
jgi:hypothetical protein